MHVFCMRSIRIPKNYWRKLLGRSGQKKIRNIVQLSRPSIITVYIIWTSGFGIHFCLRILPCHNGSDCEIRQRRGTWIVSIHITSVLNTYRMTEQISCMGWRLEVCRVYRMSRKSLQFVSNYYRFYWSLRFEDTRVGNFKPTIFYVITVRYWWSLDYYLPIMLSNLCIPYLPHW